MWWRDASTLVKVTRWEKVGSLQDFFVQNQGFNFILYVGVTQEKGNAFSQQRNKS
jgi:hypothetical protein